MQRIFALIVILFSCGRVSAQFPGAADTPGSTAIYKDSSCFVAWATGAQIFRGYLDIADTSLGLASVGDSSMALGMAGDGVVSLGDGGSAILTFAHPIYNGPGFDFAVFENAFLDGFLELAFVEVSSDGVSFFRFSSTSNTPTATQVGPFDAVVDPTHLNNLAGKYRALFGTPFDLQELDGIPLLNINSVTHVKIIDAVGSINPMYATYDQNNNPINDPYPTPFPSSGFDLDAVGVIYQLISRLQDEVSLPSIIVFPNPVLQHGKLNVKSDEMIVELKLMSYTGEVLLSNEGNEMQIGGLSAGVYFLSIVTAHSSDVRRVVVD
jgi:hypothetical protein